MDTIMQDNIELAKATRPDSFQVIPAIVYVGTEWYKNPQKYNIEIYDEDMLRELEISIHSLVDGSFKSPYGFNGKGIKKWLPYFNKLSRAINDLGIPSELNDEHILIGRCSGREDLEEISRELFLDIVSFYDKNIDLYHQVNKTSKEIANDNKNH
jgi:hypothetical protein